MASFMFGKLLGDWFQTSLLLSLALSLIGNGDCLHGGHYADDLAAN